MAQIFTFQRSDTIPRTSTGTASQQSQPETEQYAASDLTMNNQSWGVHGHASEQLNDFRASTNNLVNLSAELLALLVTLPQQQRPANLPEFREKLVDRVSALNNRGRMRGYAQSLMDRCCYVVCAALDEGINNTGWGRRDGWENHSLLSRLFQQRNGGEVFFVLLDQARQHPDQQYELLELMYLLLRMGFQGRYQRQGAQGGAYGSGHDLTRLSAELYTELRRIQPARKDPQTKQNNKEWRPLKQFRRTPWLILTPALLLAGYIATAFWIDNYNQTTRMNSLDTLQQWIAPDARQSGGTIYNSTPIDMEQWQ
ncbi:type IVB secretion system protein IcmH/DotU [Endozoicomonadaceae bacterium StTr2]